MTNIVKGLLKIIEGVLSSLTDTDLILRSK